MKKIYLFLLISTSCHLYSQTDGEFKKVIQKYRMEIDSINNIDYSNQTYIKSIADGVINRSDGAVGGFGIETLSNRKKDTIFRIQYDGGIDIYTSKTYYYKSNKLVYAILEISDFKNKLGTLYKIEEFYKEAKKIYSLIKVNKLTPLNCNEANINLYDDGNKFINDELRQ